MKILIADDDLTSRRILETLLAKWDYTVISAENGTQAWEMLKMPDRPRIAVLDWMMPDIEGDEICRRIRQLEKNEETYTYLILLTAKGSTENIVSGMEAGADDYIVKPFDQHELHVRVRAGQRIIQLQSELLSAKQKLLMQSRTDPLTGALNRRAILSQLEIELNRASRENKCLSLSLLDIDHFKRVNDTYGHIAGDHVIQACVRRIEEMTRIYDILGRFGGEEFLIIFPGTETNGALTISHRIRSAIAEKSIDFEGSKIDITVSQGIVTCNGNMKIDALIDMADRAMYQAKKNGRNRVEQADPGQHHKKEAVP